MVIDLNLIYIYDNYILYIYKHHNTLNCHLTIFVVHIHDYKRILHNYDNIEYMNNDL